MSLGEVCPTTTNRARQTDSSSAETPNRIGNKTSTRRTQHRIDNANLDDRDLIGEYLPSSAFDILPVLLEGPDDTFTPPAWLLESIRETIREGSRPPEEPQVKFDTSPDSIRFNTDLLKSHAFDLDSLIAKQSGTTMWHGAEFRTLEQLRRTYGSHPNFPFVEDVLSNGMPYHFTEELSETDRLSELHANLERGNHKSAMQDEPALHKMLESDVRKGFAMPVHKSCVAKIKGAMVQPCGLAEQHTLTAEGGRVPKKRLTHDLSYSITREDASVNSRIDMEKYPEMIYGCCLHRILHWIAALRRSHPGKRILISKYDFSDAYRRMTHSPSAAAQTVLVVGDIAYVMLRLAFGGAANPPAWCAFSEMITDLANEIALDKEWDPINLSSRDAPPPKDPVILDETVPISKAEPMSVVIPTTTTSRADCFIDDIVNVFLDTPENRRREPHKVPLAVEASARPHAGDKEPIQRKPNLAPNKLAAEATPAESQVVLGWEVNTRLLTVALPDDKFKAWILDLESITTTRKVTEGDLDSIIGRLNHAAFLIPLARHFLGRVRRRLHKRTWKDHEITLSVGEVDDLHLWKESFLPRARDGISINLLTQRRPTNVGWSDSCPFGAGGFHQGGRAWRFRIPESSPLHGGDIVNNFLEFLGMAVNIYLMILDADASKSHQCFLVLGDNTSGLGWMIRSGRLTPKSPYFHAVTFVARLIASLLLQKGHCLARQHIQGRLNTVPDLLSFVGDQRVHEDKEIHPLATTNTTDDELTRAFHRFLPQLIPQNFNISPLPTEVSCFIIQALQIAESTMMRKLSTHSKAEIEPGDDGKERELILRGFLTAIRTAQWDRSGRITGTRKVPVASATVRSATSHLATAFRIRFERSPLHIEGTDILRPTFRDLLKAFDNVDPPPNRQQAITPRFLRVLFAKTRSDSSTVRHTADLIITAFFFACRSCEYVETPSPGVTRRLKLRNFTFRDNKHRVVPHSDPQLATKATMVTVCFENQKNRTQMDRRTHTRTLDLILCPVRSSVSIVQRILTTIPHAGPDTDICTVLDERLQSIRIDSNFTLALLRDTCRYDNFGFNPREIGNKSIRSGAAMALFMTNTLPDRIMLLGRWKSLAFMAYIRPQVLQWSNKMASSMIKFDHFFETHHPTLHSDTSDSHLFHHHGRPIKIKSFNIDFDNIINASS